MSNGPLGDADRNKVNKYKKDLDTIRKKWK